jgi:dimeric dUTPase (all-alpha-NTP-PPase superfamily)
VLNWLVDFRSNQLKRFDIINLIGGYKMNLDYTKLYSQQLELDKRIESEHGLEDEDLVNRKILALLVEVGELANETRCFKFWSKKPSSEKKVILEEYVDGIHFILSLGLELDYQLPASESIDSKDELSEQFLDVISQINQFQMTRSEESYRKMLGDFLHLGTLLGITTEEIMHAYYEKNQTNHERQEKGY